MARTVKTLPAGIAAWQAAYERRLELFAAFSEQSDLISRWQSEIDTAADRQGEIVAALVKSGLTAGDVAEVIGWTPSRVGQAASRAKGTPPAVTDVARIRLGGGDGVV